MLEGIINWASVLTGENRTGGEYYYETKPVKRLGWRLRQAQGQIIGLIGLQGTGKTSALWHVYASLARERRKIVFIKWTSDWKRKLLEGECYKILKNYVMEELANQITQYGYSRRKHRALGRVPQMGDEEDYVLDRVIQQADFDYELLIGKSKLREREKQAVFDYLRECEVIFIDLPDYQKTDRRNMTRDLSEVQDLWEKVKQFVDKVPSIVVAIQKELFTGHFFFGKMYSIELELLKPEELVYVFRKQFPQSEGLISDDSILLLGQLSRGVFRRFLKYLNMALEEFATSGYQTPVKPEHVRNAITVDTIAKDMELELFDTFKDANQRRQAVELLNYLREQGELNQKEIAEFLGTSMSTAARIINRLYRYIERKRGEGREWLISLKV